VGRRPRRFSRPKAKEFSKPKTKILLKAKKIFKDEEDSLKE
jgi:hypothetical protein